AAERLGGHGHGGGEAEVRGGTLERAGEAVTSEGEGGLGRAGAGRRLGAHADGGEGVVLTGERDLVEGGHAVARADLAGVDLVVAEVFVGDVTVLVAEQPVPGHGLRVELDL